VLYIASWKRLTNPWKGRRERPLHATATKIVRPPTGGGGKKRGEKEPPHPEKNQCFVRKREAKSPFKKKKNASFTRDGTNDVGGAREKKGGGGFQLRPWEREVGGALHSVSKENAAGREPQQPDGKNFVKTTKADTDFPLSGGGEGLSFILPLFLGGGGPSARKKPGVAREKKRGKGGLAFPTQGVGFARKDSRPGRRGGKGGGRLLTIPIGRRCTISPVRRPWTTTL